MILRAEAVGEEPCIRYLILKPEDSTFWNGVEFTSDIETARKHWHPSEVCYEMQAILKEHYRHLPEHSFVVPVEITVHGNVTAEEVAQYLARASVLSLRTEEYGNGPRESFVAPTIHWDQITSTDGLFESSDDNPVVDWGLGPDIENGET